MSYSDNEKFQDESGSPGRVRLHRLAEAAGIEVDGVDARQCHRLSRALESGFQGHVRRAIHEMDRPALWRDALDQMPKRWWFIRGDLEVVVTGFGPFQAHASNPSKPFAKAVAAGLSSQIAASYEGLDVAFHAVDEFVRLQDYASQPVLVHCGLSEERDAISLERYAHNIVGSTADNDGETGDGALVPGGPVALETLLPVEALAEQFNEALTASGRVAVETSRDAGTYVCNALYYRSLMAVRQARLSGRAADALFIHIPQLTADTASHCGRSVGEELGDFIVSALSDRDVAALE
ncbi:MAG: hypothetical protein ACQEVA_02805 [Myxococcota bacterium]